MAERPPQYSFTPQMMQQLQLRQQQQHQQQQEQMHGFPNQASNSNNPAMQWQATMNQFRPQNAGGNDMSSQMAELLNQRRQLPQQQHFQFHDQNQNQSQPGFLSNPAFPTNQNQQNNQNRMLNAFQNQPNNPMSRQLELMRMQQQQGMNPQQQQLQTQQDPFNPSDAVRRPSPHLPQQPVPARNITPEQLQELRTRLAQINASGQNLEMQLTVLSQNRNGASDAAFAAKVRGLQEHIAKNEEAKTKLIRILGVAQAAAAGSGNPQGPQPPMGGAQNPPNWMQASQPQPPFSINQPNPGMHSSPAMHPAQPGNFMGQPARPPTVQQPFPPGGPPFNGNQGNPNANLNPGAANGTSQQLVASQLMNNIMHQLPPPLEKQRFDGTYRTFCESKGSSYPPYVQIDDRPIDLHTLHTLVMQAGGYKKVQANDSMSSIAGRMGFVQFPGGGTEPPKSGPATAQHLTHIYQSYLMEFDNVYIKSVLESKKRQQAVVYANQNINGPIRPSPQQMTLILSLAGFTTQELKAQGVHEKLISFIDSNRNQLQRTLMEQRQFKDTIQHPHSGPGPSPALANSPPTSFPAPQNGFQPPGRINPPPQGPARPNIQVAVAHIHKVKTDILSRHIPNLRPVEIPIDQRLEYNNLIEQLHRGASEIDGKLPMFIAYFKDTDQISKLLTTIVTVQQQRTMLSANNQRFIVGLDTLKIMMNQIQQANDAIIAIAQQRQANPNAAIMPGPPRQPINPNPAPIPPHQQPSPQPGARIPLRPPPPSKKAGTTPNPKTPTPPPSTPVASASTPVMAASPPATPKSPPKTKAPPKKPPVRARRPSTRAAPVVPPTEVASPSNVPVKRPREEDVSVSTPNHAPSPAEVANEPSPPKRIKTEWEGPPTEAIRKQNEAVEKALQSDDEAVAFFDKMSELLRQATNAETQESSNLSADLTETLDQILKGCSAIPDAPDSLLLDSIRESSPPPPMLFSDEFFDFSSYAGSSFDSELPATEDDGSVSKAPTPDLISSSANPSPESEADTSPHAFSYNEVKVEEFPDPLRLGVLKEIDGGEAAYYHSNDWKYDAPMPVPEQPWAIFTSMA